MKNFTLLLILSVTYWLPSGAQNFEWADFMHSSYTSYQQNVADMTMDEEGNVYTLGTYQRNRVIGNDTIKIHAFDKYSCYIMKHSPDGKLQWINPFGSKTYDGAKKIVYTDGHVYASVFIQGDSIYHRDGKFAHSRNSCILKFDTDGNMDEESVFHHTNQANSLEAVDTMLYLSSRHEIFKLSKNLEKTDQLKFNTTGYVTIENIQNVNDTSVLITGSWNKDIGYQNIELTDTYTGEGNAGFIAYMNTNNSLHWMKTFGNIREGLSISYSENDNKWYLGGDYSTDFELEGHPFTLTKLNGTHSFIASLDLQGNLLQTGQFNPMGQSGWIELNGVVANNNRVFVYGKSVYGTLNYNQQDTLVNLKDRFGFVFKLNENLEPAYNTAIYPVNNGADITAGVMDGEQMYFGGRTHGSGAIMGCDNYETGGYYVCHIEDNEPDEKPLVRFGYTPRLKGKYYFRSWNENYDYHYWDFGDGTPFDSTSIHPIHQYNRKGEIKVKLHAGNQCGESVLEKKIYIDGIGAMSPGVSANTNLYMGHIKGVGFKPDATFRLVSAEGEEKEIRETVYVDSLTYGIMVEFDDAPLATYNLYMENGEDKDTLLNALTLEEYEYPEIECEWSGPKDVLAIRMFSFMLTVHNRSNTAAYSVPISIVCNTGVEIEIAEKLFQNETMNQWLDGGGHFRTVEQNSEQIQIAPFIIPAIPPRGRVNIRVNVTVDQEGEVPVLKAYWDPPLHEPEDFFVEAEPGGEPQPDELLCPGSEPIESVLRVFGIEPSSEAGFNINSFGCLMMGYIVETFGVLNGFGSSGYGGGYAPGTFTGNANIPPANTTPINMGPLIYESLRNQYPQASNEELDAEYEKIAETLTDTHHGNESNPSTEAGPMVEIEYPENIVCVGDCSLEIKVIGNNKEVNPEDNFSWEIDEERITIDDISRHLPLLPIPKDKNGNEDVLYIDLTWIPTNADELRMLPRELTKFTLKWSKFAFDKVAQFLFNVVASRDPNEKYTIQGYGDENYIERNQDMTYHITFENASDASAPASEVFVYDTLDLAVLDTTNFKWNSIGWGENVFHLIEQEGTHVIEDIDMRPYGGNVIVRFEGKISEQGVLSAVYTSLDTLTMDLTQQIFDGFLPPNSNAPEGEGFFNFTIGQQPDLPHGTRIENQASIIFDYNEEILTSTVFNTIDTIAPVTGIVPFETEVQSDTIVSILFEGDDDGSGMKGRNVFIKKNDGPFVFVANNYPHDTMLISANYGDTLNFYTYAEDKVGNIEDKPVLSEAQIIIAKTTSTNSGTLENTFSCQIYPNPTSEYVNFKISNRNHDPQVEIWIYNELGRAVQTIHSNIGVDSNHLISWDLNNYYGVKVDPGIYIAKIIIGDAVLIKKIVVQNN